MIQRIQTIYLLLIVLTVTVLLWANPLIYSATGFDKWTGPDDGKIEVRYTSLEMIPQNSEPEKRLNSYLIYDMAVSGLLAFLAIFMFKNRKMQLLLCGFNYIFMLGIGILCYVYIIEADSWLAEISSSQIHWYIFIPVLLPIFNFMVMRGIYADERLIKSMNRLR